MIFRDLADLFLWKKVIMDNNERCLNVVNINFTLPQRVQMQQTRHNIYSKFITGIHREFDPKASRVKSLRMDTTIWTPSLIEVR